MSVIFDSTCLIAFERIGKLDILNDIFTSILIPPAVKVEFGIHLDWLKVTNLDSSTLSDLLKMTLGKGEAEAIALALQTELPLISDDKQARAVAKQLGIKVKGALGILVEAKRSGAINEIRPIIDDMEIDGFRISAALRKEVLLIARE